MHIARLDSRLQQGEECIPVQSVAAPVNPHTALLGSPPQACLACWLACGSMATLISVGRRVDSASRSAACSHGSADGSRGGEHTRAGACRGRLPQMQQRRSHLIPGQMFFHHSNSPPGSPHLQLLGGSYRHALAPESLHEQVVLCLRHKRGGRGVARHARRRQA